MNKKGCIQEVMPRYNDKMNRCKKCRKKLTKKCEHNGYNIYECQKCDREK